MNGNRWGGWWRFPLWSWRHLASTVLAVVVLMAALGRLTADDGAQASPSVPLPATSVASEPGPTPAASSMPGSAPSTVPTPSGAMPPEDVATQFVRAWARPGMDDVQWRTDCSAFATSQFVKTLEASSSSTVSASRVVAESEILERSQTAARVRVLTDGGAVMVDLQFLHGRWLVAGLHPEAFATSADAAEG